MVHWRRYTQEIKAKCEAKVLVSELLTQSGINFVVISVLVLSQIKKSNGTSCDILWILYYYYYYNGEHNVCYFYLVYKCIQASIKYIFTQLTY